MAGLYGDCSNCGVELPPSAAAHRCVWTLQLNKYQRDNLLWLINACGWPGGVPVMPFGFANTGDWLGEIGWMLAKQDQHSVVVGNGDQTNKTLEQLRQEVDRWRRGDDP